MNFKKRRSERGVVLIIVLMVVAILTTLVVDLIYFTHVDTEISANTRDEIKSRYIAKSGVYVIAGTIKNEPLENITAFASTQNVESGDSKGYWTIQIPFLPFQDGSLSMKVIDERSKINLNALVSQTTNNVDRQVLAELKELFRMLGVDTNKSSLFISSLTNWLDRPIAGKRNDQDSGGASADYYAGLENPYQIKDGPLDSVEEIRLINGMDEEFFNLIKDYVTVYPADKKINFSTAPKVVIKAAVKAAAVSAIQRQESGSPEEVKDDTAELIAEAVIEARKDDPIVDIRDVREMVKVIDPNLKINPGLSGVVLGTGKSDVFSLTSVGTIGGVASTSRVVNAVVRKSGSESSQGVNIISWKER
ncbi:MAG: type II secretion system minor pseudopilin GspK [Candidatus Dadabacteria bacterium]|nr:type II secretion system minor pseudopilin GspK [Candidatus Dadabacteria bacterium]